MRPFYVFTIVFNLVGFNLYAVQRPPAVDSLKKLINLSLQNTAKPPDTLTISRVNQLADDFFESYPDSTRYYGKLEIALSKKIHYLKGIADGSIQLGAVSTLKGSYDQSASYFNTALKLYQKLNNGHGIGECYIGLGRIQDYLGNYNAAIGWFDQALTVYKKTGNELDLAECYNIMGITYDNKGEFSKALDCYFKSLIINIKYKDSLAMADKYSNIGVVMQQLEVYPKALSYYDKALAIWQRHTDLQGISTAYQNIGEVLIAQKKYHGSLSYLSKAMAIFTKMGDAEGVNLVNYDLGLYHYYTGNTAKAVLYLKRSLSGAAQTKIKYNIANAYMALALVYNQTGDYTNARDNAAKGQATANSLGSLSIRADAALQLANALAGLKQFEEAYHQQKLYTELRTLLKHNESLNKVTSYNLEIDFAKKQQEIFAREHKREHLFEQKIERQHTKLIIITGICGVMAILLMIYYFSRRKHQRVNTLLAQKNSEILAQEQSLKSQAANLNELNLLKDRLISILAHDLRAPISTLRGLFGLMTDDSITPEEFVAMAPKVFNTLEHTSDFLDTLLFWINSQVDNNSQTVKSFSIKTLATRELAHLEDQLKAKNIVPDVDIEPDAIALADPNSIRIVMHNFLTNAIKFSNRNGAVNVSAYLKDSEVVFCVKDNGVGMSAAYLDGLFKSQVISSVGTANETGTGMGLLFCKDLVQKYNGTIWANSIQGSGTELCFKLPAGDDMATL